MNNLRVRLQAFAAECDELDRIVSGSGHCAPLLREADEAIGRMRVALSAIAVGAPPDMQANDPEWVRRIAKEALGE